MFVISTEHKSCFTQIQIYAVTYNLNDISSSQKSSRIWSVKTQILL